MKYGPCISPSCKNNCRDTARRLIVNANRCNTRSLPCPPDSTSMSL